MGMIDTDIRHEAASEGVEFSLSGGVGQWIDDVIAVGAVVILLSALASRAYRWAKAEGIRSSMPVERKVHQVHEAGSAAVRAWRSGDTTSAGSVSPAAAGDGSPKVPAASHSTRW